MRLNDPDFSAAINVQANPLVRPGLLVLPGWDDDGKQQYDDLKGTLARSGWLCRRADLPDASWPAARRDSVTREDSLVQAREDLLALASGGAEQRVDSLAALGFSYGGYMAALLVSSTPIDWLVLRSPALYPDDDWLTPKADLDKRTLDAYRHRQHAPASNRALASCSRFKGEVLLIDSSEDRVIPSEVIDSYAAAFSNARSLTRHTLAGADHELSRAEWRKDYHALAVSWLTARQRHSAASRPNQRVPAAAPSSMHR